MVNTAGATPATTTIFEVRMTEEAEAKFLGRLVRVVDREGGVWWTLPEHVEAKRNLERTHLKEEASAAEVEYQRLYWRPKP